MKTKILDAIRNGNNKTREIISAIGAELQYREFCKAISELQCEGKVILINTGYQLQQLQVETEEVDLNDNEKKILNCMIENTKDNGGFILDELTCFGEFTIEQLKGYASSLQKKGFVEMYGRDSYNDGRAFC